MQIGINLADILAASQAKSDPAVLEAVDTAIQSRRRFKAGYEDASIIAEPYALVKTHNAEFVSAVVIYADKSRYRGFEPAYLDASKLSDVVILADSFFPNWSFDADDFPEGMEVVTAIEPVAYPEQDA